MSFAYVKSISVKGQMKLRRIFTLKNGLAEFMVDAGPNFDEEGKDHQSNSRYGS